MAYLGRQPNTGVRSRYIFTATASQTTFSGSDDDGKTLKYEDAAYLDVFLNGVLLKPVTDYTATSKTSVVLTSGAAASDIVEIVAYDIANIANTVSATNGGTFEADVTVQGTVTADGLTVDTDTLYVDAANNRVGVGDATPDRGKLQIHHYNSVSGGVFNSPHIALSFNAAPSDNDAFGGITYPTSDSDNYGWSAGAKRTSGGVGDFVFTQHTNSATGTERARIDSSGNLILNNSPASTSDNIALRIKGGTSGYSNVQFADADDVNVGMIQYDHASNYMQFTTNDSERARIDSSGNFLVGKTTTAFGTAGVRLANTENYFTVDSSATADFNRLTNDGDIVKFYKNGTTIGNIGTYASSVYIGTPNRSNIVFGTNAIVPANNTGGNRDNAIDLGESSVRYDDIYATNGTIQTSDANEKQDIAELDEAEKRVATAAKGLIRKFRWISSVEEKGDDARIHVGVIAQDLKAAFEAEGLDPGRYAMFISTTWWEANETYTDDEGVEQTRTNTYETAEEAPEGAVERTRLGVRYNQLLAFIIGAM